MPLPPPPPPPHLHSWPDRAAMLADRSRALNGVVARALSLWWLLLLWVLAGAVAWSWSLLVAHGPEFLQGAVGLPLALLILAPLLLPLLGAAIGLACALHHLLRLHQLLRAWHGLATEQVPGTAWRRRALTWFVTCGVLGGAALCAGFAWILGAGQGDETYVKAAEVIGGTTIAWLAGLAGIAHARASLRWWSTGGPPLPAPGAHTARNID